MNRTWINRGLVFALVALVACTHRATVMQSRASSGAPVTGTVAAPAEPEGFWSDTIRPLASLSRGWNRIPGRYGTGCAHDSAFAFKVRPGLPDKVLIFLNGGGACWRAQDCDPKGKFTYTMSADSANDVSVHSGLFDPNNDKNPVREYTIVFVPSCTGDVHLGSRESDYDVRPTKGSARTFSVRHGGAANLEAVLDWVYVNLKSPRAIFVAGISTGAIASPVVAEKVARHYPRARVSQLGDAAGAYDAPVVSEILGGWGATEYLQRDPGFKALDSARFSLNQLYLTSARVAPRVHYAQVNAAADAGQASFLTQLGVRGTPFARLLDANLSELRSGVPWFRSYTVPGKAHTILRSSAMYGTTVDGVKFVDWLAALIEGGNVEDVGGRLLAGTMK